jgi:DNA processing protein
MSPDLLLAFVSSKINLNKKRLDYILDVYTDLDLAVLDDFQEIDKKTHKWLQKFSFKNLNIAIELEKLDSVLNKNEIKLFSILNQDIYPKKLLDLSKPPIILYYQGNLEILKERLFLTVVGSRSVSQYAKMLLDNFLAPICSAGIGVVSGLAVGIDTMSHRIALDKKAKTIAVIGSGLDNDSFYPSQNLALKKEIIETHNLIISEYPPGIGPDRFNFPARNRILAALTDLTWIVQASLKSGSLITANLANDLNRTVATSPANVFDKNFEGNTALASNGANLITDSQDIFQLLNLKPYQASPVEIKKEFSNKLEEKVYNLLSIEPVSVDFLSHKLGFSVTELNMHLTMLELNNLANSVGENMWVRNI